MQLHRERREHHDRHRREILERIVRQLAEKLRALRVGRIRQQQRVAVGIGFRDEVGADDA
jgi:hypothetical protein